MVKKLLIAGLLLAAACGSDTYQTTYNNGPTPAAAAGGTPSPDLRDAWRACCVEGQTCDAQWEREFNVPPGMDPNCDQACPDGQRFNVNTWQCNGRED